MKTWSDQDLIKVVKESLTYRQVALGLNLKATSGNYVTIKKYIKLLEIG